MMRMLIILSCCAICFVQYFSITAVKHSCRLGAIGKKFSVDKFLDVNSYYAKLYCALFEPIRRNPNLKMLEIGFGCEHSVVGRASLTWKKYFDDVKYYGMDYFPWTDPKFRDGNATKCMTKFNRAHPNVTEKVWFGDQANVTFLLQVVAEYASMNNGQKTWDIIIDDGGHYKPMMETSFATLWQYVAPGGYCIIEDLHMGAAMNSSYSVNVVNWIRKVAYGFDSDRAPVSNITMDKDVFLARPPKDLMMMGCAREICYYRKDASVF